MGHRQPRPAVPVAVRDGAALAQVLPDRVRVGHPAGVGVIEVGGPVLDRGMAAGHGYSSVREIGDLRVRRQRAQFVQHPFGCFLVPPGHGDLGADHERPEASQRRQVQAEDLVQDLYCLVPAPGRGQGLGQVRGDRRRDLPAEAELPGPGQALPARRNGELVTAAALERVGDGEVGPRLEQPKPARWAASCAPCKAAMVSSPRSAPSDASAMSASTRCSSSPSCSARARRSTAICSDSA